MQEFQQRVVDEKKELDEKIVRLKTFLNGEVYRGLPKAEQLRLGEQHSVMMVYSDILSERISAFVQFFQLPFPEGEL